jgi:hypothetical protein
VGHSKRLWRILWARLKQAKSKHVAFEPTCGIWLFRQPDAQPPEFVIWWLQESQCEDSSRERSSSEGFEEASTLELEDEEPVIAWELISALWNLIEFLSNILLLSPSLPLARIYFFSRTRKPSLLSLFFISALLFV